MKELWPFGPGLNVDALPSRVAANVAGCIFLKRQVQELLGTNSVRDRKRMLNQSSLPGVVSPYRTPGNESTPPASDTLKEGSAVHKSH